MATASCLCRLSRGANQTSQDCQKQAIELTQEFMPTVLLSILLLLASTGQAPRREDNSDWWSLLNEDFPVPAVKPQNKDLEAVNFQILGVVLGNQLEQITAKLGRTRSVQRGDASTGREQVCYVSVDTQEKVHLIFEFGEVESAFYLFAAGADWTGSNLCRASPKVSPAIATAAGLKLGLTRAQVEAILGDPDFASDDKLVYYREVERKVSAKEFAQLRKDYPEKLTDREAHEKFDSYTVGMYVEVRLVNSQLNYLAVSRTATD